MTDLSTSDAVAETLHHLLNDPDVAAALGGDDRVSGVMEAPWPHVVVSQGGDGDLGLMRGRLVHEVKLELYGPMDHSIGAAELYRIMLVVLTSVADMSERDHPSGHAVVCRSVIVGGVVDQPLSNGQSRLTGTASVTVGLVK